MQQINDYITSQICGRVKSHWDLSDGQVDRQKKCLIGAQAFARFKIAAEQHKP